MPAYDQIAIIYNPNSTGDAEKNARQLRADLRGGLPKVAVTLLPTKQAGHAIELAESFAKKHKKPLIVSASGDGGYHEVINGAMRAQAAGAKPVCAVLPSGNANDHARTMQDQPLADQIIRGSVTALDLLKVTVAGSDGKPAVTYAHSYLGIGLTPTVAVELNKQTLNSIREAIIILRTFWRLKPVTILVNGKKRRIDSLLCSVIPEMAKVLTITKDSKPQDGRFELTIFEHNRKLKLLYRLLKGALFHMGAQKQLATYTFTVVRPAPMQLDGEIMKLDGGTKVDVALAHKALRTVV